MFSKGAEESGVSFGGEVGVVKRDYGGETRVVNPGGVRIGVVWYNDQGGRRGGEVETTG